MEIAAAINLKIELKKERAGLKRRITAYFGVLHSLGGALHSPLQWTVAKWTLAISPCFSYGRGVERLTHLTEDNHGRQLRGLPLQEFFTKG